VTVFFFDDKGNIIKASENKNPECGYEYNGSEFSKIATPTNDDMFYLNKYDSGINVYKLDKSSSTFSVVTPIEANKAYITNDGIIFCKVHLIVK